MCAALLTPGGGIIPGGKPGGGIPGRIMPGGGMPGGGTAHTHTHTHTHTRLYTVPSLRTVFMPVHAPRQSAVRTGQ